MNVHTTNGEGAVERTLLVLLLVSVAAAVFQIGQMAGGSSHGDVAHASTLSEATREPGRRSTDHRDGAPRTHLGARMILDELADPPRLHLDLTADAADGAITSDGHDPLIAFDPPLAAAAFLERPNVITWKLGDIARATRYQATLTRDLTLSDDTRLPAGSEFTFSTAGPRVLQMEPYGDLDDDHAVIHAAFDLPVTDAAVKRHVTVHDEEDHLLSFRAEACPRSPAGEAWHLILEEAPVEITGQVEVLVDGSLTATVGAIAFGEDRRFPVRFLDPLELEDISSWHGRAIELDLNRSIALPDPTTIRLEPAIPFQIQRSWRGIQLLGDFPPGEYVRVTLRKGFPGHGRARLAEDRSRRVKIRDLRASLSLVQEGHVLSSRARPEIEVEGVNVHRYAIGLARAYPNNVLHLMREGYWQRDAYVAPEVEQTLPVHAEKNETFHHRVDLAAVLGAQPRGVYIVSLRDMDGDAHSESRLIQITNLRVSARVAKTDAVVHVSSIADGSPREGAEVRILTRSNQLLAEARTDAAGLARLPLPRDNGDRDPFLIETRDADDAAWVDLASYSIEFEGDDTGGAAYLEPGAAEAFVAFDRGVARPGETVHATVLVRDADGRVPVGAKLVAVWADAFGQDRITRRVSLPASGLIALDLETAPSDPTGSWSLSVKTARNHEQLGVASIRVDTIVPDRIELTAEVLAPPTTEAGGALAVKADWLAGGGVAFANATVRVRYEARLFRSNAYPRHGFAPIDPITPPGALPPIRTVTDARGEARVAIPLPLDVAAPSGIGRDEGTDRPTASDLVAKIEVEVEDPSGRPARAHVAADLRDDQPRVGVRYEGSPGAAFVDLVLAGVDGALAPIDTAVSVEIRERSYSWEYIAREDGSGRWERGPQTHVLAKRDVQIERGHAALQLSVTPVNGGFVFAHVEITGPTGLTRVSESALNGAMPGADVLAISAPTQPVVSGAAAMLRVHAPFAGTAVLTLESTTIHHAEVIALPRGDSDVQVTIPDGISVPNLFAVCVLARPQAVRDALAPVLLVGRTPVPIDHAHRGGALALEAPDKVEPETRVSIGISLPGATTATVALVDVGVLRLTRHPAPDPLGHFLRGRRLQTTGADTATGLLTGARYNEPDLIGGDEDHAAGVDEVSLYRQDGVSEALRSVALFSGAIALDSAGQAEVAFVLPPYEGRLRAVAIAAGSDQIGAATRDILVEAPLSVLAAAPRILTSGDRTHALVTVKNRTGGGGALSLSATASGDLIAGDLIAGDNGAGASGGVHWNQPIADQETATFEVPLIAGASPGAGALRVHATLGGYAREISLSLPIRSSARRSTERIAIVVDASMTLPYPGEWLGGTLEAELKLDLDPARALIPAAMTLLEYPHGCCEQTSSRGIAILAARELIQDSLPDGGASRPDELLHAAVERVLGMRTWNGGFAMWPGGNQPSPLATLVACDFLTLCSSLGMHIPDDAVRDTHRYLRDQLERWVESGAATETSWATWAAEVLSRTGAPIRAFAAQLVPHAKTTVARTRLALALKRLGDPALAVRLLADLSGFEPRGDRDDVDFGSPVIARAWLLRALLECAPKDARAVGIADALQRDILRPEQRHTQELAHALLALRGWMDAHQPVLHPLTVAVSLGDREVVTTLSREEPTLSIRARGATGDVLSCRADGPLFGSLVLRGFRVDPPAASIEGLHVAREIIDESTGLAVQDGMYRRGQTYRVTVRGEADDPIRNLLVMDPLPAGFELETDASGWFAPSTDPDPDTHLANTLTSADYIDRRDDRILFHVDGPVEGPFRFTHRIRAVFSGSFVAPPVIAEALYDPGAFAGSGDSTDVVIRP